MGKKKEECSGADTEGDHLARTTGGQRTTKQTKVSQTHRQRENTPPIINH